MAGPITFGHTKMLTGDKHAHIPTYFFLLAFIENEKSTKNFMDLFSDSSFI